MGQRKLCRGNGNVKICIDVLCVDDVMKLWWSKHLKCRVNFAFELHEMVIMEKLH